MEKLFIKLVGIMAIAIACSSCVKVGWMKGNGNLITLEKSVSSFEKIKGLGVDELRFYESDQYRVIVTVDSNLEDYVDVYTKNNVLYIGISNKGVHNSCMFTKYLVDVYCPVLTGVTISGSGSFKGVDEIIASSFEATISGSGNIEGKAVIDNFTAKISGSGKISFAGTCSDANISIFGSGKFSGNEFDMKNAAVDISGSGKANICVSDYLNAKITGSGEIIYSGQPKIESKISGSGKLKKR